MNAIQFYSTKGQYGCFSNFSRHPITINDKIYPTSEHLFQAMKFWGNDRLVEMVRTAETPTRAAIIGRDVRNPLREDWEGVKDHVMLAVVGAKFIQNGDIREILLSTGHSDIIEHTENDNYWGDGGDGSGKNMLGTILKIVRSEFQFPSKDYDKIE